MLTLRSDLSDQVRLPDLCKFIPIKEVRRSIKRSDFSVSDWWKQRIKYIFYLGFNVLMGEQLDSVNIIAGVNI